MKTFWCLLALLGLAASALTAAAAEKEKDVKKADTRYFEMRTYHAAPGKIDALNARFRDHTNALFKKHGMEIIGFWTDVKKARRARLHPRLPQQGGAREELEGVRRGSRLDQGQEGIREGRQAGR